jgi:hypothetical protein
MIDADAYAEQVAIHLAEILPEEPNAIRVRLAGGTRNIVGELVGATETRLDLRVDIRPYRRAERGAAGEAERGDTAIALLEDALEPGDLVEAEGHRYRVIAVQPRYLAGRVHCYDATAERLDVERGSPVVDG